MESIGDRIKKIRKAKGITQRQLAEKCGMKESAIGRIETKNPSVRTDTLTKIAHALEVDPQELMPTGDNTIIPAVITENGKAFYYCDGLAPECKKTFCYIRGNKDGCYMTSNKSHALTPDEAEKRRIPMILDYKKTDSRAIVPTRGSKFAAGYDLYAIEYKLLAPGEKYKFRTGLAIELPPGYFGTIKSRSGVSWKQNLDIVGSAGTIDEDYRGEITVPLWNTGKEEQLIEAGQRIAQLVIEKYTEVDWREVNELHPSERGAGGFGSTGA